MKYEVGNNMRNIAQARSLNNNWRHFRFSSCQKASPTPFANCANPRLRVPKAHPLVDLRTLRWRIRWHRRRPKGESRVLLVERFWSFHVKTRDRLRGFQLLPVECSLRVKSCAAGGVQLKNRCRWSASEVEMIDHCVIDCSREVMQCFFMKV